MKYMAGGSVKDLLEKKERLTFEKALEITRQAGSALEKAHREGLVHRDVKPGNILLEENGTARLADFGFSKAMQSASGASLSMTGGMVGTPAYMAPELWDKKEAGPTSDLYSLVCVFYEMMLGRALFDGETPSELMKQHIMDRPQYPQRWPQGVPGGIEGVLEKALAKEAGKRHGSVTVFLGELRELSRGDRINFQQERRAASQTEKNGRSVKGAAGSMMPALPAALSVIWRGWR